YEMVDHVVLQFDFMMTGTGHAGLRLNRREPVAPQHLVTLVIETDQVSLRQAAGWSTSTRITPLDNATVHLARGRWYTGVLEVDGNEVTFGIDGRRLVRGTTVDQSATPRNHFVLQAFDASVAYDNVKVWEGVPR